MEDTAGKDEEMSLEAFLRLVDELLEADATVQTRVSFSPKWRQASTRGALLAEQIEQCGFRVEWDELNHIFFRRKRSHFE